MRKQLETLRGEIEEFQQTLEKTRDERAKLEENLKQNEKKISDLLKKIERIENEIDKGEQNIGRLENEREQLQAARAAQQTYIGKQIRAAWEMGRQGYLKVLLNQEDPHRLARILTYYDYINRARAERIARYTETIARLRHVGAEIQAQNRGLARDRQSLEARSRALVQARAGKEHALTALNRRIETTGAEMEKRVADRERLEALLERITRSIANLPTPGDAVPFASRKGELLLPAAGGVTDRFGSARNGGKLHWNGVFIEAGQGDPVHAIH
ncbi:MAG: hypothetical protein GWN87_07440, partial [Desulfuromonadales bacterium]|nr:hypothetical protein [Desulfuromonadales bacterium]